MKRRTKAQKREQEVAALTQRLSDLALGAGGVIPSPDKPTPIKHTRTIVQQCQAAGVKCWVESLWIAQRPYGRSLVPSEWPEDLRVREVPNDNTGMAM